MEARELATIREKERRESPIVPVVNPKNDLGETPAKERKGREGEKKRELYTRTCVCAPAPA